MRFDIHDLWQTPVFAGALSADSAPALEDLAASDSTLPDGRVRELGQALAAAAPMLLPPRPDGCEPSWQWKIERWQPGYHAGLRYSPGNVQALVVLQETGAPRHPESGQVSLHDPRVGANKVFLPGLPWGRHRHLSPRPGSVMIFPSWLGWSVAPVQDGHTIDVCLLHTDVAAQALTEALPSPC
jgi:hypothetical protein